MTDIVLHVVLVGGFALVLSLALAPMESLGWWAGWLGPEPGARTSRRPPPPTPAAPPPRCFVVFLSGIGSISGDELLPRGDAPSSTGCRRRCPRRASSATSFPTRPPGRPLLTGQRVFAWLWRRVLDWRLNGTKLLPALLNLRNLFQVLVSADHRYGPLYSFGIARVARERLEAHGYVPRARASRSCCSARAAAARSRSAPPPISAPRSTRRSSVVTFGGVMASDRGIEEVERLASLYGTDDRVYALGRTAFPGRWPVAAGSFWNTARPRAPADRAGHRPDGPLGAAAAISTPGPRPDGAVPRNHRPRGRRRVACSPQPSSGRPRIPPLDHPDQHRIGEGGVGAGLERIDELVPEPVRPGELEPRHRDPRRSQASARRFARPLSIALSFALVTSAAAGAAGRAASACRSTAWASRRISPVARLDCRL